MPFLHVLRGAVALTAVLMWLAVGALPSLLLLAVPARLVTRAMRLTWVSRWATVQCRLVMAVLEVGGARYVRCGRIPTDQAGVILMNHQSVLDIPTAILMSGPFVPAFVARERYARVPLISTGLWLADCPVIDPRRDREGAIAAMARAVREDRPLLIYPEGHRARDGSLQPFRTAGLLAVLSERRVPVWLLATDGFYAGRRVIDLVHLHRIRGVTKVLGPYAPPQDVADLPAFVAMLERELANALEDLRATPRAG